VRAFAKVNPLDREIVARPRATVGIVTCGKAHFDLLEVFRRLDIPLDALAAAGCALQGGPRVSARADAARGVRRGLSEILVVEEKGAVVETQLRDLFYNAAVRRRSSASATRGQPLVSELGELRPSRLIEIVARWLAARFPQLDRRHLVRRLHRAADCSPTPATPSSACRTSAPAARTTPRPRCPRARARRPASAATSWRRGWTATPKA
jgi:indolepyruvate ferredoxin oxidoreductase